MDRPRTQHTDIGSPSKPTRVDSRWARVARLSVAVALLCGIPSIRAAEPVPPVKSPLSPEESLQTFRLAAELKIEIVAAEPEVVSPISIAFDEEGRLWIACHRPDSIYVYDIHTHRLDLFAEDWQGEALRGPTDVAFAGPDREILLAASLDNLVVHRFDNVGTRGLRLNNPKL